MHRRQRNAVLLLRQIACIRKFTFLEQRFAKIPSRLDITRNQLSAHVNARDRECIHRTCGRPVFRFRQREHFVCHRLMPSTLTRLNFPSHMGVFDFITNCQFGFRQISGNS